MINDDFEREHLKDKMYLVEEKLIEEEELMQIEDYPPARIELKEDDCETLTQTNNETDDSALPF